MSIDTKVAIETIIHFNNAPPATEADLNSCISALKTICRGRERGIQLKNPYFPEQNVCGISLLLVSRKRIRFAQKLVDEALMEYSTAVDQLRWLPPNTYHELALLSASCYAEAEQITETKSIGRIDAHSPSSLSGHALHIPSAIGGKRFQRALVLMEEMLSGGAGEDCDRNSLSFSRVAVRILWSCCTFIGALLGANQLGWITEILLSLNRVMRLLCVDAGPGSKTLWLGKITPLIDSTAISVVKGFQALVHQGLVQWREQVRQCTTVGDLTNEVDCKNLAAEAESAITELPWHLLDVALETLQLLRYSLQGSTDEVLRNSLVKLACLAMVSRHDGAISAVRRAYRFLGSVGESLARWASIWRTPTILAPTTAPSQVEKDLALGLSQTLGLEHLDADDDIQQVRSWINSLLERIPLMDQDLLLSHHFTLFIPLLARRCLHAGHCSAACRLGEMYYESLMLHPQPITPLHTTTLLITLTIGENGSVALNDTFSSQVLRRRTIALLQSTSFPLAPIGLSIINPAPPSLLFCVKAAVPRSVTLLNRSWRHTGRILQTGSHYLIAEPQTAEPWTSGRFSIEVRNHIAKSKRGDPAVGRLANSLFSCQFNAIQRSRPHGEWIESNKCDFSMNDDAPTNPPCPKVLGNKGTVLQLWTNAESTVLFCRRVEWIRTGASSMRSGGGALRSTNGTVEPAAEEFWEPLEFHLAIPLIEDRQNVLDLLLEELRRIHSEAKSHLEEPAEAPENPRQPRHARKQQLKQEWWARREELDTDLGEVVYYLNDRLFGIWRTLFTPSVRDPYVQQELVQLAHRISVELSSLVPPQGVATKPLVGTEEAVRIEWQAVYILLNGLVYLATEEAKSQAYGSGVAQLVTRKPTAECESSMFAGEAEIVRNLRDAFLRLVTDGSQELREEEESSSSAFHDEIEALTAVAYSSAMNILSAHLLDVSGKSQLTTGDYYFAERRHLFLILDARLHSLPFEAMPTLRPQPVSRIPSLSFLEQKLTEAVRSSRSVLRTGIREESIYYILNPSDDVPKTEARLAPTLTALPWMGSVGLVQTPPPLDVILQNDLVIYLGHGAGGSTLPPAKLRHIRSGGVVMLMGCSSAGLDIESDPSPSSPPMPTPRGTCMEYLLSGTSLFIGCLWDVTDGDIDRFFLSFLTQLSIPIQNPKRGPRSVSPQPLEDQQDWMSRRILSDRELCQAVAASRRTCKLPFLTGASLVCYGVPVRFS